MSAMERTRSLLDMLGIKAPDIRAWAALGFFLLTYKSLDMVDHHAELLKDAAFMGFIGMLATGGIIAVGQNLFGGTRSGQETNAALAKMAGTGSGTGGVDGAPKK